MDLKAVSPIVKAATALHKFDIVANDLRLVFGQFYPIDYPAYKCPNHCEAAEIRNNSAAYKYAILYSNSICRHFAAWHH